MRARHALVLLLAAAVVPGCGGDDAAPAPRAAAPEPPAGPSVPPELRLPAGVPRAGDGRPALASHVRVIRRWSALHRRGDLRAAARLFALPSRFQNVTPVLTVEDAAERLAVNASLTCGGRPVRLERAGDFTVVTFRLQPRPGARCGGGGEGRATIRVRGGRIVEFYRLIEGPGAADDPSLNDV